MKAAEVGLTFARKRTALREELQLCRGCRKLDWRQRIIADLLARADAHLAYTKKKSTSANNRPVPLFPSPISNVDKSGDSVPCLRKKGDFI
jgi:hypothetical protein